MTVHRMQLPILSGVVWIGSYRCHPFPRWLAQQEARLVEGCRNIFPPVVVENHYPHCLPCKETRFFLYLSSYFKSLSALLIMSLVDSFLCNAIFLIVAFALAAQKTAAQAVLCGQYQNLTSTSGQYTSKSKVCTNQCHGTESN